MSIRTFFVTIAIASFVAIAQPSAQRHEGKLVMSGTAEGLWVEIYDNSGQCWWTVYLFRGTELLW